MSRGERNSVSWSLCGGRTLGPAPFFVAGIVNVTPDSFYDGGVSAETGAAVDTAMRLFYFLLFLAFVMRSRRPERRGTRPFFGKRLRLWAFRWH